MKSNGLKWTARTIAVLMLAASVSGLAQDFRHKRFSGMIDAFSPQTAATATKPASGPYEIHGPWVLKIKENGKADFYAAVNMELSDGWAMTLGAVPTGKPNFDPNSRDRHTHHITIVDGDVTQTANGIEITSPANQGATVTLNGGTAPISPTPLTIDITGSTEVEFSNITLTFGSPGSNHFGSAPVTGVVRSVR